MIIQNVYDYKLNADSLNINPMKFPTMERLNIP